MACKCKESRAKLLAARERKKAQRKGLQAAALDAVLAVTDAAAKVVGIDNGEVEDDNGGRLREPGLSEPGDHDNQAPAQDS